MLKQHAMVSMVTVKGMPVMSFPTLLSHKLDQLWHSRIQQLSGLCKHQLADAPMFQQLPSGPPLGALRATPQFGSNTALPCRSNAINELSRKFKVNVACR
ncbi:hypothetical protein ABBQ38_011083 [Trebouxia sp. C0009 RCD-2024]